MELRQRGEKKHFEFKVIPGSLKEGHVQIRAVLTAGGKTYSEGYTLVTREDLASAYYYQPAIQRVSIVDVKVPKDLKVALHPGRGRRNSDRAAADRNQYHHSSRGKTRQRKSGGIRNHRARHPRLRYAERCSVQQQEAA